MSNGKLPAPGSGARKGGHEGGKWSYKDELEAGNHPVALMLTREEVAALDALRGGMSRARAVGKLITSRSKKPPK